MSDKRSIPFRVTVFIALSIICLAAPAWADYQAGMDAYSHGDYAAALREWRPLAEHGHANAQVQLGNMYMDGLGVRKDKNQAVIWYHKAAEQGNTKAQAYLGDSYGFGQGVPQDNVQAVMWYRKAAEQGDTSGQIGLGVMYINGLGVPQDYALGHMWFNLAAANGAEVAGELREDLAKQMTPAQIAEAQRLAREWKPRSK